MFSHNAYFAHDFHHAFRVAANSAGACVRGGGVPRAQRRAFPPLPSPQMLWGGCMSRIGTDGSVCPATGDKPRRPVEVRRREDGCEAPRSRPNNEFIRLLPTTACAVQSRVCIIIAAYRYANDGAATMRRSVETEKVGSRPRPARIHPASTPHPPRTHTCIHKGAHPLCVCTDTHMRTLSLLTHPLCVCTDTHMRTLSPHAPTMCVHRHTHAHSLSPHAPTMCVHRHTHAHSLSLLTHQLRGPAA
eukprot:GHVU01084867.1.p3 GENE.GHVU01084867.1~~GHVU01084867.1.p3  ORF type:complete len:245 (+),score=17.03 GHVU01084867.1:236-970(+)